MELARTLEAEIDRLDRAAGSRQRSGRRGLGDREQRLRRVVAVPTDVELEPGARRQHRLRGAWGRSIEYERVAERRQDVQITVVALDGLVPLRKRLRDGYVGVHPDERGLALALARERRDHVDRARHLRPGDRDPLGSGERELQRGQRGGAARAAGQYERRSPRYDERGHYKGCKSLHYSSSVVCERLLPKPTSLPDQRALGGGSVSAVATNPQQTNVGPPASAKQSRNPGGVGARACAGRARPSANLGARAA